MGRNYGQELMRLEQNYLYSRFIARMVPVGLSREKSAAVTDISRNNPN